MTKPQIGSIDGGDTEPFFLGTSNTTKPLIVTSGPSFLSKNVELGFGGTHGYICLPSAG